VGFAIPFLFLIHALLMGVDEIIFHRKRNLPLWERWGHPIDTLSFLSCLLFIILFSPSQKNLFIFFGLSFFSCLIITKDEWIHHKHCSPQEMWLHALLFVLHPFLLVSLFLIWPFYHQGEHIIPTITLLKGGRIFLPFVIVNTTLFLFYQIFYWNFYENKKNK